jgi:plasmid stability protein
MTDEKSKALRAEQAGVGSPMHGARASDEARRILSTAERSELRRQGAKAAARGESSDANPLHESQNKPPATGESVEKWSKRQAAWQQGHDAQSVAPGSALDGAGSEEESA